MRARAVRRRVASVWVRGVGFRVAIVVGVARRSRRAFWIGAGLQLG